MKYNFGSSFPSSKPAMIQLSPKGLTPALWVYSCILFEIVLAILSTVGGISKLYLKLWLWRRA